jgi:hypothetical protein
MTTPEAYNARQRDRGAIPPGCETDAVRALQEALGVLVDGYLDPITVNAWDARRRADLGETEEHASAWALEIVKVAEEELGKGEAYQDNAGEDLHRYRDFPYGDDFARPIGHWCAFFVGYVIEQAAARVGLPAPKWRRFYDQRFSRRMPIGNARALATRVAEAGRYVARDGALLEAPIAGDIGAIKRGRRGSRAGHVFVITEGLPGNRVQTIEGNTGRFPSLNVRKVRDLDELPLETIGRLV